MNRARKITKSTKRQKGLTLILFTLVFIVFMFFAGLAFDFNHATLNKTRLQNSVDAAALAAAVKVSDGFDTTVATSAAKAAIATLFSSSGNTEVTVPDSSITVQYSNDPQDFSSGYDSNLVTFVRVSVADVPLNSFFIGFFGSTKQGAASAVAGPSSSLNFACNIVPIAVCAATSSGSNDFLGFNFHQVYELKVADHNASEMGPGNFQLLDFGSGASTVRDAIAGGFDGCVDITENATTKPGNTIGPVGQGLNTRFGDYSGGGVNATDFPPDIYVREPTTEATTDNEGNVVYDNSFLYSDYLAGVATCDGSASGDCTAGNKGRRILPIPMVDCVGSGGGATTLPITSIGCFFLLQKAPNNNGAKQGVFGEFLEDCTVQNGGFGSVPDSEGLFKIQLYKDPGSGES